MGIVKQKYICENLKKIKPLSSIILPKREAYSVLYLKDSQLKPSEYPNFLIKILIFSPLPQRQSTET